MKHLAARLALSSFMAFSLIWASGASAQTLAVHNPLPTDRADAIIDLPVPAGEKVLSARIGTTVYPVQYIAGHDGVPASLRLAVSLKAHETAQVTLSSDAPPPAPPRVLITLNIQDGGTWHGDAATGALAGGVFHLRDSFTVPGDHVLHDGLIAFEGIGWESDRVAYRLYLDQRNVTDIFGKFGTAMIFPDVGHGFDDYQYPRAWGGDIYKVGSSLGVGGIGLLRDGKATQIGPATVTGRVIANGPVTAIAGVDADAIAGGQASLHATYAITAGSTLTRVNLHADALAMPMVTGLAVHAGDITLSSLPMAGADWDYIAVWGAQEHGPDFIGTVVFYHHAAVTGPAANDGQTLFIQFISATDADYAFAARWVQENKDVSDRHAITDIDAFKTWLEATRADLDHPITGRRP